MVPEPWNDDFLFWIQLKLQLFVRWTINYIKRIQSIQLHWNSSQFKRSFPVRIHMKKRFMILNGWLLFQFETTGKWWAQRMISGIIFFEFEWNRYKIPFSFQSEIICMQFVYNCNSGTSNSFYHGNWSINRTLNKYPKGINIWITMYISSVWLRISSTRHQYLTELKLEGWKHVWQVEIN